MSGATSRDTNRTESIYTCRHGKFITPLYIWRTPSMLRVALSVGINSTTIQQRPALLITPRSKGPDTIPARLRFLILVTGHL